MFDLTVSEWVLAAFAAAVVGMTKAGIAGLGMISILIFADKLFTPKFSTGVLLPILILGDMCAMLYYRRHADHRMLIRLLPAAVVGILAGFLLMDHLPDRHFKPLLGGLILVLVTLTILRDFGIIKEKDKAALPADGAALTPGFIAAATGLAAGLLSMLANAAGPIMMVYLLAMRYPKNRFIGTTAWFFTIVNLIKVPFQIGLGNITAESLVFDLKMLPAIIVGFACGILIVRKMTNKVYTRWVQIIAALLCLRMIFS